MSYITLSSRENPLFQKIIPWWHFFLLCSCFRAHPTNTTSQNIGGGRIHGPFQARRSDSGRKMCLAV